MKKREPKRRPASKHRFRGDRLQAIQDKLGMGRTEFAIYSGLKTPAVVSDLVLGKADLTCDKLAEVCEKLDVSANWLLGLSDVAERR